VRNNLSNLTKKVNDANVDCLQKGINDLCTWAEKWQLRFSIDKITFIYVHQMLHILYRETSMSGINEARDLRVLVDAQLLFKSHINGVVAKARMRAEQILDK